MKQTKRILSVVLCLVMLLAVAPVMEAGAATFEDINSSVVFLKQQGSSTCTLVSAAMMMRRYAMLRGDSDWDSITESSLKPTAWSGGLRWSFTYKNISVNTETLPTGSENTARLISLLSNHPEGIVLYRHVDSNHQHAVLLTDYTDGTFYCADPLGSVASGRIPISQAYWVTISGATQYWYVTSPRVDYTPTYTEPPTAPTVSVDKKIALINDDVTISFSSERASNYWIGIYSDGDLWTQDVVYGNSYTINYAYVGKYDIVVVARNNCGSETGYASFKLGHKGDYAPENFHVSCNKKTALKNTDITFTFSADNATNYWIGVYTGDGYLYDDAIVYGNTYTTNCPWEGDYSVAIVARNDCTSSETKYLSFTVVDSSVVPTIPAVSVSKKVGLIHEDVEISFFSENVNNYWIGIYSDGDLWTQDVVYGNSYTINYAYVGKYDIAVVARNDNGSAEGYASFRLGNQGDYVPSHVIVSCDKPVALKNEPITISFSAELADAYWLGIYKDGQWVVRENIYGTSYTNSFSSTGEYSVALVAMNECSSAETKYVSFDVVDKTAFDINFNANGGYAAPASQSKPYGREVTLSTQKPVKTGFVFQEWNTESDGSGQAYLSGAAYSADADLTLYAIWNPCSHQWNLDEESLPATCSATGTKTFTCTACNATKTETIPINASNHVNTTSVDATNSTCTEHGYTAGVYCNDCKQYISGHEEQPLAAHTLTTVNQRTASCTAEGYTGDQYCTTCKQTISTGSAIGKKAHTLTTINQKAAGCTEAGYTGDQYCTTCKQTISRGSAINALGHASADGNGNCTRCGAHIKDVTPPQPQPNPNACKWCGEVHTGFFGKIVGFFHSILAIFKR